MKVYSTVIQDSKFIVNGNDNHLNCGYNIYDNIPIMHINIIQPWDKHLWLAVPEEPWSGDIESILRYVGIREISVE